MAEQQAATTTEGTPATPTTPESSSQEGVKQQPKTETTEAETEAAPEAVTPEAEPEAELVYEFTAPEGANYDPEVLKAYEGIAREVKMAPEAAQKMLETLAPVLQARQDSAIAAVRKEWEDTLRADEALGGPHLKETLATAQRALDAYPGGEALRKLLDDTGLGGEPNVVGLLNWVGRQLAPDTKLVTGNPGGLEQRKDPIQRLAESYARTD